MDLVSIETFEENMMVMKLVHEKRLKDLWTSGRLCNFKGCDAKHLQPRKINGMYMDKNERLLTLNRLDIV